ncbi:MAG: carboxylesterase/lipase family protein [Pseudomonadales bacterium]|nr:carboxylesterase/lipase family protein [Pseudomonadales bacterium]
MSIRLTRRAFSAGSTIGLAAMAGGSAFAAAASQSSDSPVARTHSGPVRGVVENGIRVFKGIPYGGSTAGANRFGPAQEPAPWKEPLDTFDYGAAAPQPKSPLSQDLTTSEDCLVLNVWTPALDDGGKRPVMVWLHGGGFSTLSGSSPMYDGGALCRRGDVVVLTLNHRLNVFGFLHLEDIAGGQFAGAGNQGMLDIVHALRWVRRNIRRFGGNPDNVTIFGESGGGRKVSTLMGMPAAKGLFHRAIIQSGPGLHLQPRDKASEVARSFLDELKIAPGAAASLKEVPVEQMLVAHDRVEAGFDPQARARGRFEQRGFVPTVGVPALPAYAFDPVASELSARVPLLIGSNRHELALFTRGDAAIYEDKLTEAELADRVAGMAGGAAARVLQTYASAYPGTTPAERWLLMLSDRTYRFDSITLAQRKAALGPATWMYYFTWESETDPKLRSHHALEIPFAFDNVDQSPWAGTSAKARALALKMSSAWIAFARDGDPNTPVLPEWPEYDSTQRATMVLDETCTVLKDPDAAVRLLWATV